MNVTELPIKPDEKGRPRLVMCPVLHCNVDLHKCYRCVSYRGKGAVDDRVLLICAAPPLGE